MRQASPLFSATDHNSTTRAIGHFAQDGDCSPDKINEISHWAEYDYVIVNDELEDSHAQVTAILTAERLRRRRRVGLTEFVRQLTKGL